MNCQMLENLQTITPNLSNNLKYQPYSQTQNYNTTNSGNLGYGSQFQNQSITTKTATNTLDSNRLSS